MNILIPMAGLGKRFVDAGYTDIKPLIPVNGKPMIIAALDSLQLSGNFIFVIRNFDGYRNLVKVLETLYRGCEIILLTEATDGPARTCLYARKKIDTQEELVITNCDQIMNWYGEQFLNACRFEDSDGTIVTYNSTKPQNSYARLNHAGLVSEVAEKKVISNVSLVGIHYWKHGCDFVSSAMRMIYSNDRAPNGEFYVAPTYNYLINQGRCITAYHLPDGVYNSLGSPEDLDTYLRATNTHISTK